MAQASKAVYPKDAGGPYGKRIAVSVQGSLNWALRVEAFVTGRASYTFPVGVTTLWWFAPATSAATAFMDDATFAYMDDILGFDANTTYPEDANFTSDL
ncbi:hypothetical protein C0992_000227 [Termitomyces sp. T32_za158]|nr:hypothetical protein C0992_000227 [Termitomyces sp. T32_za158]